LFLLRFADSHYCKPFLMNMIHWCTDKGNWYSAICLNRHSTNRCHLDILLSELVRVSARQPCNCHLFLLRFADSHYCRTLLVNMIHLYIDKGNWYSVICLNRHNTNRCRLDILLSELVRVSARARVLPCKYRLSLLRFADSHYCRTLLVNMIHLYIDKGNWYSVICLNRHSTNRCHLDILLSELVMVSAWARLLPCKYRLSQLRFSYNHCCIFLLYHNFHLNIYIKYSHFDPNLYRRNNNRFHWGISWKMTGIRHFSLQNFSYTHCYILF